jgi:hypothetical protein
MLAHGTGGVGAAADRRRWPARRSSWTAIAGAIVATLVLLLAFQQVVTQVVRQGALRRQAQAEHAQASWRCGTLADPKARRACQALLVPAWPSAGEPSPLKVPATR